MHILRITPYPIYNNEKEEGIYHMKEIWSESEIKLWDETIQEYRHQSKVYKWLRISALTMLVLDIFVIILGTVFYNPIVWLVIASTLILSFALYRFMQDEEYVRTRLKDLEDLRKEGKI